MFSLELVKCRRNFYSSLIVKVPPTFLALFINWFVCVGKISWNLGVIKTTLRFQDIKRRLVMFLSTSIPKLVNSFKRFSWTFYVQNVFKFVNFSLAKGHRLRFQLKKCFLI